jgi:hypothetical protein
MEKDYKREIEGIIGEMTCPKDFKCYKSGLESLCKAGFVHKQSFLRCLEKTPTKCKFSLSFEEACFCKCPLRVYIAKKLGK